MAFLEASATSTINAIWVNILLSEPTNHTPNNAETADAQYVYMHSKPQGADVTKRLIAY